MCWARYKAGFFLYRGLRLLAYPAAPRWATKCRDRVVAMHGLCRGQELTGRTLKGRAPTTVHSFQNQGLKQSSAKGRKTSPPCWLLEEPKTLQPGLRDPQDHVAPDNTTVKFGHRWRYLGDTGKGP